MALEEITIDFDMEVDCKTQLVQLYNAYMRLVVGKCVVQVRHDLRWTHYEPGKSLQLLQLYNMLRAACPDATTPNLNPAYRTTRGRPARLFPY